MTEAEIIDLLREYLWAGVWISAPLLITALVVGVAVGLFQALTSIQELTLTFVPKLVAMLVAFTICIGFSANLLLGIFDDSLIRFVAR
jgi:flagellar biosynthetic protein FliQ